MKTLESFDDAFCLALADKHKAQYPVIADDDYTSLDTLAAEWGIELNEGYAVQTNLNDLLTNAVLMADPHANIAEMDEWDKALFLKSITKTDYEYVSLEDALIECGVN